MKNTSDATILAQRGVRQLTSEERDFYNNVIDKMKAAGSANPMMALTNTDKTFPLTIITQVMEDMKQEHPLLAAVDTVSVSGLAKILVNADGGDNATWGELESTITKEIDSAFKEIDMSQNKLSAWMPISIDMLELGANWLDTYIRTCLSEALAIGFENGIVTGTISMLAKNEQGKNRAVRDLILVCNPQDYFKIVMPATTIMTPDGKYVNDVLPYPTKIIPSVACAADEAILGMGKRYFLGVGGKRGIQFSDDYKFLEDKRYYKIVAYANGRAKDNNSFLRLDISGLKRLVPEVITIDPSDF